MAEDLCLLESYGNQDHICFRHYGWSRPAVSFGYSQKYTEVARGLEGNLEIVRRPTGGGLVDHRNDWTYSLVIPPAHPLYRSPETYRIIHEALVHALNQKIPGGFELEQEKKSGLSPACFTRAERSDVICSKTRKKIAGAAQKRTHDGLLTQGSLEKTFTGDIHDWERLEEAFVHVLHEALGAQDISRQATPVFNSKKEALAAKINAVGWNRRR